MATSRLVPALDEWPGLVASSQSLPGRLVLVAVFTAGLVLHGVEWWAEGAVVLVLTSLLPGRRRALLLLATLTWLARHAWFPWTTVRRVASREGVAETIDWRVVEPAAIAAGLVLAVLFHVLSRARPGWGPLRRPVLTWVALVLGLFAVASYAPVGGTVRVWLWAIAVVLGRYVWFVAFSLLDRRDDTPRAVLLHVGHWLPFWMSSTSTAVPFPKGSAYLRRIEAKDGAELAVTQLKAIKLLWWAGVLLAAQQLLEWFLHGSPRTLPRALGLTTHLALPGYAEVFEAHLRGTPFPTHLVWAALVARFLTTLLGLAVFGHVIVAVCRMTGFRALRNTYRPLEATTIAEFWNRYYYYFKELLVDLFFYPTFLRYLKGRPRARLFVATLAAAGGGNVLYHFLQQTSLIASNGLVGALWGFRVYALYGLLLGTAIGVSQMRRRNREEPAGWWSRRVLAPLSVLGFYCVLSVFDAPLRSRAISDHVSFLSSLVGVS